MFRTFARMLLLLITSASLALTGITIWRIAGNPALSPFVDRSAAQIVAATDRLLANAASPAHIAERLDHLLTEPVRNWIAMDAILAITVDRAIPLPDALLARIATARASDTGLLATAGACASCAWNPATCALSAVLICQAPMVLTPMGDLAGVTLEAGHFLAGAEVDRINLALSLAGLAAMLLVPATAGSSASVKFGVSTAKLARRMGLVSPGLSREMRNAARDGIDWASVPAARSKDMLLATLRPAQMAPLIGIVRNAGRLGQALPPVQALHLIRYVDGVEDSRRLALAAEALGPRTVGSIEVIGKSRFLRATLRYSDTLWSLMAGLSALLLALASLVGNLAQTLVLQTLRRAARK